MEYLIKDLFENRAGISAVITCSDDETEDQTLLFKPSLWVEEALHVGDTFGEERMEALCATAQYCQVLARAEGLLANSDYSRNRLVYRLMRFGFPREVCERAADTMVEKGYIREREQALRTARFYCKVKHWGKKRIAVELMGRGYGREAVRHALDAVTEEEYFAALMKLVDQKYPRPSADEKERQKRIAALMRMGYSYSEIERVFEMKHVLFEEETQ